MKQTNSKEKQAALRTLSVLERIAAAKKELNADKYYGKGHTASYEKGAQDFKEKHCK